MKHHQDHYIYWGTIATDKLLSCMPFGREWLVALSAMSGRNPTYGRDINVRLYRDFASLRSYQLLGFKRAREQLIMETQAQNA